MRADFDGLEQKLTDMIKLKYGDDAPTNQVRFQAFGVNLFLFRLLIRSKLITPVAASIRILIGKRLSGTRVATRLLKFLKVAGNF